LFLFSLVFAVEIIIVGEVNYLFQIMADGQTYEVANTAIGDDLVINHTAEKVEITGTIEEKGETKTITVKSFKVVPKINNSPAVLEWGDKNVLLTPDE
jgi:hypothetical protein